MRRRPAKDPELGLLSDRLKSLEFLTELLPESQAKLKDVELLEQQNKLRGVRMPPSFRSALLIQLYVGGEIRTFGSVHLDLFKAARAADLLIFRFGRFRLRFPTALTEADFNFSASQAQADYDHNPELRQWADDAEAHLRSIGALCSEGEPRAHAKAVTVPKSATKEIFERLDRIEEMLTKLCVTLSPKL